MGLGTFWGTEGPSLCLGGLQVQQRVESTSFSTVASSFEQWIWCTLFGQSSQRRSTKIQPLHAKHTDLYSIKVHISAMPTWYQKEIRIRVLDGDAVLKAMLVYLYKSTGLIHLLEERIFITNLKVSKASNNTPTLPSSCATSPPLPWTHVTGLVMGQYQHRFEATWSLIIAGVTWRVKGWRSRLLYVAVVPERVVGARRDLSMCMSFLTKPSPRNFAQRYG